MAEVTNHIPLYLDPAFALASKKRATLPEHRYVIRVIATLVAAVGDVLLIGAAAFTAAIIRFQGLSEATSNGLLLVILPTFTLAAVALNCYRLKTLRHGSAARTLIALAIAAGLAFTTAFAFKVGAIYSRLETGIMLAAAAAYLTLFRCLYKAMLGRLSEFMESRVLVLGRDVNRIAISADFDHIVPSERPNPADPHSLERTYELVRKADRIILAFDNADERITWAQFVRQIGIDAELIEPDLQNITVLGVNHWDGTPTLVVARKALDFGERALKRALDLTIGVPLLAVIGPFLLLLMLVIKLDSPGAAIFAQIRVGRNNRHYKCFKLRTMYCDMSDLDGNRLTARDDSRVTRVGKVLRRTSFDELPQLWNVIRGDMSLVGPRPHALRATAEGALYWEAVPDYWTRHAMRPGITGLAQVRGLRGNTIKRSDIEKRVAADLEYINSWSILCDLKILLQTFRVVFHSNAF